MMSFDIIFNCIYLAVLAYQALYFLVQYKVLKRIELLYYSIFLLSLVLYYSVYVFYPIISNNHGPFIILGLTAPQIVLMITLTFFYIRFLTNYLELQRDKLKLYYLIKYYSWYNIVLFFVFLLMTVFKTESKNVFAIASLLTMPVNLVMMVMTWRISSVYARVAAYAITCAVIGELICHVLIHSGTDTYALYGGNAYIPAQVGVLLDVFILGYGLSLKAAESDKKLVKILLENQKIVEVERTRLAKDLHDGLGGMLSGIKLTLGSVSGNMVLPAENATIFTKVLHQLDNTIAEMRRVAHSMMPEALLRFGLSEAIQDFCDGINESNLVKMKFTQIGMNGAIEKPTEVILYRIVQELSNNAIKHAAARNIFIQLSKHEQGLTLTVEDDGKGFDIAQIKKGDGLQNVQSRVDYLKGVLTIESEPEKGTSVSIEIPVVNIT